MAAIEQHRRPTIGGGKLKTAGCCLVGLSDFGNDARQRSVAQCVLGHGEDDIVLLPLGVKNLVRTKSDLLQARRVEVELCERPEYAELRISCKAGGDPGCKKGCRSIVAQRRRRRRNLMQSSAIEAMTCQPLVQRRHAKRHCRTARAVAVREPRAERGKLIGARPIGKRG